MLSEQKALYRFYSYHDGKPAEHFFSSIATRRHFDDWLSIAKMDALDAYPGASILVDTALNVSSKDFHSRMNRPQAYRALVGKLWSLLVTALALSSQAGLWDISPAPVYVDRVNVMPAAPVLVKSLGDAAEQVLTWSPPSDINAWKRRRIEVEKAFRRSMGLEMLPPRTPLQPRVLARHAFDGYFVDNVIFESRPGFPVTANLYHPISPIQAKYPAVLSPIGHFLSAGKTAIDVQMRCIQLARLGFIVLAYDAIGQGERMFVGNIHHDAGYALLPLGETIAGWMVWDSMRALDYLLTLDDVDRERIGMTGNSGGGLNTLFTAALDDRVHAAVIVGFTFEFNNWIKYGGAHCTCTHLPGVFNAMDWFEIAGLIEPRAVMMIQGSADSIFPISGARRSGRYVEQIYKLADVPEQAKFVELLHQPHAYSRPFRETMYGWMTDHLQGRGNGDAHSEELLQPLPEKDPRLLCDPERTILPHTPTVVELARQKARERIAQLPDSSLPPARDSLLRWVRQFTSPPPYGPHGLSARVHRKEHVQGGNLEFLSFNSEDGESIPGLFWTPTNSTTQPRVILLCDSHGKASVAESGFIAPLIAEGRAVLALDLRGRGETLGHYGPQYDTNFRLVANQVLMGRPLAGRRAYDLLRAIDYLSTRQDVSTNSLTLVGMGEDALPALLATAADTRIRNLVVSEFRHSLVSSMQCRRPIAIENMGDAWNDLQLTGRVLAEEDDIDFGSVIPEQTSIGDIADFVELIGSRPKLFCQARDLKAPDIQFAISRWNRFSERTQNSLTHLPQQRLHASFLLQWLRNSESESPENK